MFSGVGDSAGKCIFNLLQAFNLRERKSVLKRITIIKTRVNEKSVDSNGSGKECDGYDRGHECSRRTRHLVIDNRRFEDTDRSLPNFAESR